ncbi:MAG TPA: tail fiber protein [Solirubrobacteraceae bacterium]|nr:tail fiber protein [Solirubrobacteraceae bacterium]
MDPFIGEIRAFGFGYAPPPWLACEGQLLPIQRYTPLFSIIGTIYGGDGRTNFALPDLRARVPMSAGQGPGLRAYEVGEVEGEQAVTLLEATVPPHQHSLQAFPSRSGNVPTPGPKTVLATSSPGAAYDSAAPSPPAIMDPNSISPAGGGPQPHENMMPTLSLNFCIAYNGIFPKRP